MPEPFGPVLDPSDGGFVEESCWEPGRTQMCAELQTKPEAHSPVAEHPFPSRLGIVLLQAANAAKRQSAMIH